MSKLLIFDANNIAVKAIKVAFNGNVGELSVNGLPTAALFFFINSISRHIREHAPDQVMACWDGGRSTHRLGLSSTYKANRPPGEDHAEQFRLMDVFLDLAGIAQQRLAGYEADDLIAGHALWSDAEEIVIVSDDHDLRQLVSDRVIQVPVSADSFAVWTPEAVQTKYGCTPAQLPYLMALMGDPGDGVKGLEKIGPKRGLKMLLSHEFDWPALLGSLSPEDRATAALAYALVDLRHPEQSMGYVLRVPRDYQPVAPPSEAYRNLVMFLRSLQMQTVLDRLESGRLWNQTTTV